MNHTILQGMSVKEYAQQHGVSVTVARRQIWEAKRQEETRGPRSEEWFQTVGRAKLRYFCRVLAWARTQAEGRKGNVEGMIEFCREELSR
jgi:hypothetical protein